MNNLIDIAYNSGVQAEAVVDFYDNIMPLNIIGWWCFLGGLLLLGIVTMRASVLPRWAGIPLSLGAVLVYAGFLVLKPLALFGFLLIGAALTWKGFALWSNKGS